MHVSLRNVGAHRCKRASERITVSGALGHDDSNMVRQPELGHHGSSGAVVRRLYVIALDGEKQHRYGGVQVGGLVALHT